MVPDCTDPRVGSHQLPEFQGAYHPVGTGTVGFKTLWQNLAVS